MVLPILVLYGEAYDGATPLLLGLALGIYGLTQAVFQIPLGLLSDIWGRKPVIFIGLAVFACGSLIAAMATSVEGLILGRALQGSGAIASAIMAMVADLTSEENRTKAMAAIGASIGLSFSVAMILGPGIAAVGGLSTVFVLSALLALCGMLVLHFVVPNPPRAPGSHRDTGAIPALMWQTAGNTQLLRLNWGIFALHFILMTTFVVIPVQLEDQLGIPRESHWMVYLGLLGTAFILMLPLVMLAERKRQVKPVFVSAIAALAVTLAILGSQTLGRLPWLLVMLVFFTGFNLLEASLPSLVSKLSPAGAKGTAMGLYSTSQFLGAFGGGVCGGWLLQNQGAQQVYLAGAALAAVWWLIAITMRKPRFLSSICVNVDADFQASLDLLKIPGVEEALLVSEEALLYLKVDKQVLDEAELERALQAQQV